MSPRPPLALLLIAAIAVAGCGRRGALEEPGEPGAEAVSAPAPRPGATPVTADGASPGATEPPEARPGAAPERRFFLDPLI
jgi:predicted small lipoprotein YifL